MSLADFDERDLDRLADYLAGELTASAAAEVDHLVRTEPSWRQAYADLTAAGPYVQALLRAEGRSQIDPMPADVIARVDAALESAAGATIRSGATARSASAAKVVSLDAVRRRRRQVLSAAAAVVVGIGLCTGVVAVLRNVPVTGQATSSNAGGGAALPQSGYVGDSAGGSKYPPSPAPAAVPFASGTIMITSSGTNYTAATLAQEIRGSNDLSSGAQGPGVTPAPTPPGGLLPNGLSACLAQVTAVHPGMVIAVDYARYESQPAVIITIFRPTGRVVVAAGARCGAPGPDELAAFAR
jgi:cell pole-organizing protein PopZ